MFSFHLQLKLKTNQLDFEEIEQLQLIASKTAFRGPRYELKNAKHGVRTTALDRICHAMQWDYMALLMEALANQCEAADQTHILATHGKHRLVVATHVCKNGPWHSNLATCAESSFKIARSPFK